jgi:hypothetical protein
MVGDPKGKSRLFRPYLLREQTKEIHFCLKVEINNST